MWQALQKADWVHPLLLLPVAVLIAPFVGLGASAAMLVQGLLDRSWPHVLLAIPVAPIFMVAVIGMSLSGPYRQPSQYNCKINERP